MIIRKLNSSGLSLIELLFSITIFFVLSGTLFRTLFTVQGGFIKGTKRAEMQQHARRALDRMTREIRMTGSGYMILEESISELALSIAVTDTIQFLFVEDWEDTSSATVRRITYFHSKSDSSLQRAEDTYNFGSGLFGINTPEILARDISDLEFRYFALVDGEEEYTPPIEDADSLDLIQKVEVRVGSYSTKGERIELVNDVRLRSR
jgi:type II secretory pathway pseudopilin PulG